MKFSQFIQAGVGVMRAPTDVDIPGAVVLEEPTFEPIAQEPETPETPAAPAPLDYAQLAQHVAPHLTDAIGAAVRAAVPQRQQQQTQAGPTMAERFAAAKDLMYEDPAAALEMTAQIATENAVAAMMPHVRPMSVQHGVAQATQGLDPVGQKAVLDYIQANNVDASMLADPVVADLIRSKGQIAQMEANGSQNQRPIPQTASVVGGYKVSNIDGEDMKTLTGLERLYASLGLSAKFDPAKLVAKARGVR